MFPKLPAATGSATVYTDIRMYVPCTGQYLGDD